MDQIDFRKKYSELYAPPKGKFVVVGVPELNFLMLDGHGNPNTSPDYTDAVSALYTVAYGIKFALKPTGFDYHVPPLEGLWWTPDMADFSVENKDAWLWTMMILQPELATVSLFEQIKKEAAKKKDLPALESVRLETFHEGLVVQTMYLGAYADEGPTIARMHDWIAENGYERTGKHHEIYMGDPRRTAPERLKTILRQPIRAVSPGYPPSTEIDG